VSFQCLIDTDWAIHYLNGNPGIVSRLEELHPQGIGISVISVAELYEGVLYSKDPVGNEEDLRDFLCGVAVIGIDEATCRIFGQERGRLRVARKLIGDFDLLIGATAVRHDVVLLSGNRRHFEAIEGLKLISE
jgi:predicted nucleic acid-binding protein